jgi:hypothetical protein
MKVLVGAAGIWRQQQLQYHNMCTTCWLWGLGFIINPSAPPAGTYDYVLVWALLTEALTHSQGALTRWQ